MIRTQVKSTNIRSIGYDAQSKTLEVAFTNGKVYQYENVSAEEHVELIGAGSVGKHFSEHIRPKYQGKQLGVARPEAFGVTGDGNG